MINDEPTTDADLGVIKGCDCPTCAAGDDQWCCRRCHDVARGGE